MSFTDELLMKRANIVTDWADKGNIPAEAECTKAMRQYYLFIGAPSSKELEPLYVYTFYLHKEEVKREIVEALLLSDADPKDVEQIFGISEEMYSVYKELFFDVDNIVSRLDLVEYLENYPVGVGKSLKLRAFNLGPEFVYFKYANIVPRSDTQKVLVKKMFMGSAYKAMEANYSGASSTSAKAASTHAGLMLKAYEVLNKLISEDDSGSADKLTEILIATDKDLSFKLIDSADIV